MKNLKKQFNVFCIAILTVTMISCNNDDDVATMDTANTAGEFLTAKVDGVDFSAMEVSVTATTSNNVLSLVGGDSNGNTFQMAIQNYNGVGTYVTGDVITNSNAMSYITVTPFALWTSTFDTGNGTLEVTTDDGSIIEGTFEFLGYKDASTRILFSDGEFKANIE
ncbi:MAG: hypothetical protein AB8B65_10265 [Kordia sp.]|uniref:DUF6252 family protein n=1 Tax=Kordia sp. TaxID=1965332 RepID=UPI00385CF2B6